jgi:lipoyl(octanoyl) transferase
MNREPAFAATADSTLQAYLLGPVPFESALAFQRRLVYETVGDPRRSVLVLCEHPPLITVGRQGSWAHLGEPDELRARRWPVRWVNRGGGCFLHLPGQLAIYPVLSLPHHGLGLRDFLTRLQNTLIALLDDFSIRGHTRGGQPGVWVGDRLIAGLGVAVRDWVTYYGAVFNVNPDLAPFRLIRCGGAHEAPMTSLERERRGPLRPSLVRERFLEHFTTQFGFAHTSLFLDHPALGRKAHPHALATSS